MTITSYNTTDLFKKIRSFIIRHRPLTKNQKNIMNTLWPTIGIEYKPKLFNILKIFKYSGPIIIEIGFGNGKSIIELALKYPNKNFIGIEVYLPGIVFCLSKIKQLNINNLRLIYYDAVEVLETMIPDNSITSIQIFFPDPWHKKRHHKRRIIQEAFIQLISKKLIKNGIFHIATDCNIYAKHILLIMSKFDNFYKIPIYKNDVSNIIYRTETKFECKGRKLGHQISDFLFKIKNKSII